MYNERETRPHERCDATLEYSLFPQSDANNGNVLEYGEYGDGQVLQTFAAGINHGHQQQGNWEP